MTQTQSKISYLDHVWNPYTWNCHPVSEGCQHCYAEARAYQVAFRNSAGTSFRSDPKLKPNYAELLAKIPPHVIVGVNFMSDTWHPGVSIDVIDMIHTMIAQRPANVFIYTTKRPGRMMKQADLVRWPDNLFVGVSVENQNRIRRIKALQRTPAKHKWISFEPLIGSMGQVDLTGIDWVVTGGESSFEGKYRFFDPSWAAAIRDQAAALRIPYYHKQGNGMGPDRNRELHGKTYDALPPEFHICVEAGKAPDQLSLF